MRSSRADDVTVVQRTVAFLRLAAIELRHLADLTPLTADDLRHTADQCDREANELAEHFRDP